MHKIFSGFKPPVSRSQPFFTLILLAVIMLLACSSEKAMAQGDLLITPRRIVFEGKQKAQTLNLANTGTDTATFLISMVEMRMNKNGKFERITDPDSGQNFASRYLRFNPRRVTLAPHEAQTVRIQISKPGLLQQGEYRSHIYIRAEPDENKQVTKARKDSSGISVHMTPVFGITIPAIIHVGQSTAAISVSDIAPEVLNDTTAALNMVFNRTGNMSVYGDLKVNFISADEDTIEVAAINGVAVYYPTPSRFMHIDLKKKPGVNYHSGMLQIVYTTPSDDKHIKIAEAEFALH